MGETKNSSVIREVKQKLLGIEDVVIINKAFPTDENYSVSRDDEHVYLINTKTGDKILCAYTYKYNQGIQIVGPPKKLVFHISKVTPEILIVGTRLKEGEYNQDAILEPSLYQLIKEGGRHPKTNREFVWHCPMGFHRAQNFLFVSDILFEPVQGMYYDLGIVDSEKKELETLYQFHAKQGLLFLDQKSGPKKHNYKIINIETGKTIYRSEEITQEFREDIYTAPRMLMHGDVVFIISNSEIIRKYHSKFVTEFEDTRETFDIEAVKYFDPTVEQTKDLDRYFDADVICIDKHGKVLSERFGIIQVRSNIGKLYFQSVQKSGRFMQIRK
jgi:hypothetical protein